MRLVLRYLGHVLIISSVFRILPILAALIYGESMFYFVVSFFASIFIGYALTKIPYEDGQTLEDMNLTQGLILSALSFLVLPIFGALSFLRIFEYNIINSLFESYSGFTTTGLSLLPNLALVPRSLLLWRAETQWIGGIGVILIFLLIISSLRSRKTSDTAVRAKSVSVLYQAQGFSKLEPTISKSIIHIFGIYLAYTVLGIFLLLLVGLSFFESISIAFASISTGGFSVTDTFYTSNWQLAVISLLMILGAVSFILHNKLFKLDWKALFKSTQFRVMVFILLLFTTLSSLVIKDVKLVLFNLISALTTTGYATYNIELLPPFLIMAIMVCMLIGGSLGSTSGGIKIFRFVVMFRSIPWLVKKLASPSRAIIPLKIADNPIEEHNVVVTYTFVATYFLLLFLGTVVFMLFGYSFLDSSFQILSSLSTVGLQTMPLAAIPAAGKIIMMLCMLLGRLEIFPILVLINKLVKR